MQRKFALNWTDALVERVVVPDWLREVVDEKVSNLGPTVAFQDSRGRYLLLAGTHALTDAIDDGDESIVLASLGRIPVDEAKTVALALGETNVLWSLGNGAA